MMLNVERGDIANTGSGRPPPAGDAI